MMGTELLTEFTEHTVKMKVILLQMKNILTE